MSTHEDLMSTYYQAKHATVPTFLLDLLAAGDLNGKDFILLLLLDLLGSDSAGCPATNVQLGDLINLHPMEVSRRIRKLSGRLAIKRRGRPEKHLEPLIQIIYLDNTRYLKTTWNSENSVGANNHTDVV